MLKKLFHWQHLWPYLTLSLIWLVVCVVNYKPGTWLIGWDNLLPELNFGINIARTLTPVWQESQGFGLLGGIAFASELSRQLLLWVMSWFLPTSFLRYAWIYSMLLVGIVGTYHLVKWILQNHFHAKQHLHIYSTIAAIFYLCNPATLQNFFVPLEAFSSFYGFLPWILLSFLEYLRSFSYKSAVTLFTVLLIGSSAFHVQTMFVVLTMIMAVFVIEAILNKKKKALLPILLLIGIVGGATAFWLLPVGYFGASSSDATILSKQNQLATTESYLLNQSFGDLFNILTHRGYWLEYTDVEGKDVVYLMQTLREHLYNPLITLSQLILAAASVTGLYFTSRVKTTSFRWSFIAATVLTWGMLSAGSGILGLLFTAITQSFPLLHQMFRVTFTKWSVVYALLASIGIGSFLYYAPTFFQPILKVKWGKFTATILVLLSLIVALPLFQGNLFYEKVQLKIPDTYFQLFDYLEDKPSEKRILVLPAHTFWDWRYHSWGYRGSGFIWYGIKQPIIDRNFDVWSRTNETFYTQLSKAIYTNDLASFTLLLREYDVSYILIDESTTLPNGDQSQLRFSEITSMLAKTGVKKTWSNDFLQLYVTSDKDSFVSSPENYYLAAGDTSMVKLNPILANEAPYFSPSDKSQSVTLYPYANLTKEKLENLHIINDTVRIKYALPQNRNFRLQLPAVQQGQTYSLPATISYSGAQVTLSFNSPARFEHGMQSYSMPGLGEYSFELVTQPPNLLLEINNQFIIVEKDTPREVFLQLVAGEKTTVSISNAETAQFSGENIVVSSELQQGIIPNSAWNELMKENYFSLEASNHEIEVILPTQEINVNLDNTIPQHTQGCDSLQRGSADLLKDGSSLKLVADNRGAICHGWKLDQLLTNDFILLYMKGENTKGRPLKVFVEHLGEERLVSEFLTPPGKYESYYSLPNWGGVVDHYAVNVETRSLGGEQTKNYISSISQFPLPLTAEWLTKVTLEPDDLSSKNTISAFTIFSSKKFGTYHYLVNGTTKDTSLVVLKQGYDEGWLALGSKKGNIFPTFLDHGEYNGWANAWEVPQGSWTIRLIYLPQLLHFIGLSLIPLIIYTLNNSKNLFANTDLQRYLEIKTIMVSSRTQHLIKKLRLKLNGNQ